MVKESWTSDRGVFKRHEPSGVEILPLGDFTLTGERILIFKKNLLKASNYLYELVKYCDFLLKISGKVNDDRKENCLEK